MIGRWIDAAARAVERWLEGPGQLAWALLVAVVAMLGGIMVIVWDVHRLHEVGLTHVTGVYAKSAEERKVINAKLDALIPLLVEQLDPERIDGWRTRTSETLETNRATLARIEECSCP